MQNNANSIGGDEVNPVDQIAEAVAESYVTIPTLNSLENDILTDTFNATAHSAGGIDACEINKAFARRNVCVSGASAIVDSDESIDEESRCAVCFLQMVLPVQLPCSHIFCFLCVKGVALTNSPRCALCRQPIPSDFLLRPTLVQLPGLRRHEAAVSSSGSSAKCAEGESLVKEPEADSSDALKNFEPFYKSQECIYEGSPLKVQQSTVGTSCNTISVEVEGTQEDSGSAVAISVEDDLLDYHWFYEGRNGWWSYDQRTSEEIETFYQKKDSTCQVMVAGLLFVVDFQRMLQYRSKDPTKRRKIKRDVNSIPIKGVAGISLRRLDGGDEEAGEELPSDDAAATGRLVSHSETGRVDQDVGTRPRRLLTRDTDHNYAEGERRHLPQDSDHNYADGERRLLTRDIDHNYADGGRRYGLRDTDHNYADGDRRHFSRDSDHNYADGERRFMLRDADHNYAHNDTLHNTSLESIRDSSVRRRSTNYTNVQDYHRNSPVNCCVSHSFSNSEHTGGTGLATASSRSLDQHSRHQPRREGLYHRRGHHSHEVLPDDSGRSFDDSGRFEETSEVVSIPPPAIHCGDCNRPRCMASPSTSTVHQASQMCAGNYDLPPCLHIHTCHNCLPSSSHCLCCHRLCSGWCSSSSSSVTVTSDDGAAPGGETGGSSNNESNCQGACDDAATCHVTALVDKALNCSCNSRQAAGCDSCQCSSLPPPALHPLVASSSIAYRHSQDVLYDETPEYYHIDLDFEDGFENGDGIQAALPNETRSAVHQSCKPSDADDACTVELTCYSELQTSDCVKGDAVTSIESPDNTQHGPAATAAVIGDSPCSGVSDGQGSPGEAGLRDQDVVNDVYGDSTQ